MREVIVVNKHIVRANAKTGDCEPPLRVSRGKHGRPHYAQSVVRFNVNLRLIYDPEHPLPCGATVWLEVEDRDESDPIERMYKEAFE